MGEELTGHQCEALTREGDPPGPGLVLSITPQLRCVLDRLLTSGGNPMARHTAPQPRAARPAARGSDRRGGGRGPRCGRCRAHAAPTTAPVGLDTLDTGQAQGATGVVTNSLAGAGQLKSLQLNPLANTGVDPLDNAVGTQVADFKPVSTTAVTGPLVTGAGGSRTCRSWAAPRGCCPSEPGRVRALSGLAPGMARSRPCRRTGRPGGRGRRCAGPVSTPSRTRPASPSGARPSSSPGRPSGGACRGRPRNPQPVDEGRA